MKVGLRLHKDGAVLHEGVYEVSDAHTFGAACAPLWKQALGSKLLNANSIGALCDIFDERLLDELYGATITISRP
jgi:hypothetical protein